MLVHSLEVNWETVMPRCAHCRGSACRRASALLLSHERGPGRKMWAAGQLADVQCLCWLAESHLHAELQVCIGIPIQ